MGLFDISFHPSQNKIGCGVVDGSVYIFQYSANENILLHCYRNHQLTCRALELDETVFYSGSKDKSILCCDIESTNVVWNIKQAHESAISVLLLKENMLFSGDDEGTVKAWDIRENKEVFTFEKQMDYISDMLFHDNFLLCTSGSEIGVYNISQGKLVGKPECYDDELLSISLVKNGNVIVCGSQDGVLNLYNWGKWDDMSEKFHGHPGSIDCISSIDDNIICTGSSDGLIRIIGIHPNKLLGILGEHEDCPVEVLTKSHDNKYMASSSHEESVKFWNIDFFYNIEEDEDGKGEEIESKYEEQKENNNDMKNFFSDL